jgi:hypothetical protein
MLEARKAILEEEKSNFGSGEEQFWKRTGSVRNRAVSFAP